MSYGKNGFVWSFVPGEQVDVDGVHLGVGLVQTQVRIVNFQVA